MTFHNWLSTDSDTSSCPKCGIEVANNYLFRDDPDKRIVIGLSVNLPDCEPAVPSCATHFMGEDGTCYHCGAHEPESNTCQGHEPCDHCVNVHVSAEHREQNQKRGGPWCDTCKLPTVSSEVWGWRHASDMYPMGVPERLDNSGHDVTCKEWWRS